MPSLNPEFAKIKHNLELSRLNKTVFPSCQTLRDLKALSVLLGHNAFFFGAAPHALDCTVFAHLAQFLYIPIGFPQESFLNAGIRLRQSDFKVVAPFSIFQKHACILMSCIW